MEKKKLRKEILALRDGLSEEERRRASILLTERICGHQWFYRSEKLLVFVSYGSEIDTGEIIKEALRLGKEVYVPRVEGEDMNFYRLLNSSELTEGYRGILEPDGRSERYEYQEEEAEKALMLMPGAAFDRRRSRIGYGKGFYDRFLASKQALQLRTIGVGYRIQLVEEELPSNEWDIKPYQVICV